MLLLSVRHVFRGDVVRGRGKSTVSDDPAEVEHSLTVGQAAIFHGDPQQPAGVRFRTHIRGWQVGNYILLDSSQVKVQASLRADQPCILRFLHEGRALGLKTRILDLGSGPFFPFIRVRWPVRTDAVRVRQHDRLTVNLPCTVTAPELGTLDARIEDLSISGCCLKLSGQIEVPKRVAVSFTLPDGTAIDKLNTTVRSVRNTREHTYVGCQFMLPCRDAQEDIGFYIMAALEFLRSEARSRPLILMLGLPAVETKVIQEVLERRGFDVMLLEDSIDTIFRLRMTRVAMLVLSVADNDIDGASLCRLIRGSDRYTELPIVVRCASDESGSAARAAGATEILGSDQPLNAIVEVVDRLAPKPAQEAIVETPA